MNILVIGAGGVGASMASIAEHRSRLPTFRLSRRNERSTNLMILGGSALRVSMLGTKPTLLP
jgi:saccharopine dehydrogenase-like NADP-dependent oxidoreductase